MPAVAVRDILLINVAHILIMMTFLICAQGPRANVMLLLDDHVVANSLIMAAHCNAVHYLHKRLPYAKVYM